MTSQQFTAERMGAHARTRPVDHAPMITAPADALAIIDAVPDMAPTDIRRPSGIKLTRRRATP